MMVGFVLFAICQIEIYPRVLNLFFALIIMLVVFWVLWNSLTKF